MHITLTEQSYGDGFEERFLLDICCCENQLELCSYQPGKSKYSQRFCCPMVKQQLLLLLLQMVVAVVGGMAAPPAGGAVTDI